MSDDVKLIVNGSSVSGWTDIRITAGAELCPRSFQLGMTERYPGELSAVVVKPGDTCKVLIGSDVVLTGYIDRYMPSIDARQHSIRISGRGKCSDLVDCDQEWPGAQFSSVTVVSIAQKLISAAGFDIAVKPDPGATFKPVPSIRASFCETAFAVIEQAARWSAVLVYEDGDGNLMLYRAGTVKAASGFTEGVNVEYAAAMYSMDQRFSIYRAHRMAQATFNDAPGVEITQTVEDSGVPRHRLKVVMVEGASAADLSLAVQRLNWEKNRRMGRSSQIRLICDSWRDSAGKLWTPNTLAPISIPSCKVDSVSWVIGEVTYTRSERGTTSEIMLMPAGAYAIEPPTLPPLGDVPPSPKAG